VIDMLPSNDTLILAMILCINQNQASYSARR
jgi:hypothetical protein